MLATLTGLETFADRTEKSFVPHFVALGTQFEVLRPLMVAFRPCDFRVTVLALDAVLAPIASRLNIQLLGLMSVLVRVTCHNIERPESCFVVSWQAIVVGGRVAFLTSH